MFKQFQLVRVIMVKKIDARVLFQKLYVVCVIVDKLQVEL